VHGFDPLGKGCYDGLLKQSPQPKDSEMDHGFIAERRREDAITATMATSWRLTAAGFYWIDSLKDMSNAFASTRWESLDKANSTLVRSTDTILCEQRYKTACCFMPSADGDMLIKNS